MERMARASIDEDPPRVMQGWFRGSLQWELEAPLDRADSDPNGEISVNFRYDPREGIPLYFYLDKDEYTYPPRNASPPKSTIEGKLFFSPDSKVVEYAIDPKKTTPEAKERLEGAIRAYNAWVDSISR